MTDPPPPPWSAPGSGEPEPGPPPLPPEALQPGTARGRATGRVLGGLLLVLLVASVVVGVRNGLPSTTDQPPVGEVAPDADVPDPLVRSEVAARREAAGCRVVADGEPLEDRRHLDSGTAPPPEALYPDRPAHSGRHFGSLLGLPRSTADDPIDERAVLHNMEHGAVVVWFGRGVRREVATWRTSRARLGFTSAQGGAVFASPMPDLEDPPRVALRAWGVALDCDRFDPLVADALLVEHWGSHGDAPEASLSPYPAGSLRWAERA